MKKFYAFLAKYAPDAHRRCSVVYGYGQGADVEQVLKQAGEPDPREHHKQRPLKDLTLDTQLRASRSTPAPTDFYPMSSCGCEIQG